MGIKINHLKGRSKNSQKTLEDIINSASSLTQGQKDLWLQTIKQLPEQQVDSLAQFLNEQPETLNFLTRNVESKLQALQNKDMAAWGEILKQERAFLNVAD